MLSFYTVFILFLFGQGGLEAGHVGCFPRVRFGQTTGPCVDEGWLVAWQRGVRLLEGEWRVEGPAGLFGMPTREGAPYD